MLVVLAGGSGASGVNAPTLVLTGSPVLFSWAVEGGPCGVSLDEARATKELGQALAESGGKTGVVKRCRLAAMDTAYVYGGVVAVVHRDAVSGSLVWSASPFY